MIGTIRGAGGGSGGASSATYADDTLQSKSYFSILDILGEGIIGGPISGIQGVYLDGSPIENPDGSTNIENATFKWVPGSVDQNPIDGFDTIQSPYAVSTQVTKSGGPKTITIDDPNVDQIRAVVTFPALTHTSKSSGSVTGTDVSYKFEVATDGGSYMPILAGSKSSDGGTVAVTLSDDGYPCVEFTPASVPAILENAGAGGTLVIESAIGAPEKYIVQRQYFRDGEWHDYESEATIYCWQGSMG